MTTTKRDEPVAQLVHTNAAADWANSTERLPVFTLTRPNPDFDPDTPAEEGSAPVPMTLTDTYTMPAKPNPGLALKYLRMAREQGDLANSWLIETAIGRDGYIALEDDLVSYEGDPIKLLQSIVEKIQTVAMGGLDPKA